MSVLVALKMEGRLAGAILTVLSLVDVTTRRKRSSFGRSRVGYIFRVRELQQAEPLRFSHTNSILWRAPPGLCNW